MTTSGEKTCPFCGETIKASAIKCKHCQSNLDSSNPLSNTMVKNKQYKIIAISFVFAFLFFISNPTKEDFLNFFSKYVKERSSQSVSAGRLNNESANLVSGFTYIFASGLTERQNYIFFSVFTLSFRAFRAFGSDESDKKFIGILGQIFPLSFEQKQKDISHSITKSQLDDSPITKNERRSVISNQHGVSETSEIKKITRETYMYPAICNDSNVKTGHYDEDLSSVDGIAFHCDSVMLSTFENGRALVQVISKNNGGIIGFGSSFMDYKTNPNIATLSLDRLHITDSGKTIRYTQNDGLEGFCFFDKTNNYAEIKSISCVAKQEAGDMKKTFRINASFTDKGTVAPI